jgi:hypothetical protein
MGYILYRRGNMAVLRDIPIDEETAEVIREAAEEAGISETLMQRRILQKFVAEYKARNIDLYAPKTDEESDML